VVSLPHSLFILKKAIFITGFLKFNRFERTCLYLSEKVMPLSGGRMVTINAAAIFSIVDSYVSNKNS
jgi:hypothetical protein